MDDRRPGEGSTWGGGSYEGPEPKRAEERPAGETAGNFPTFGRTPGWQDEPDPYATPGYGTTPYGATSGYAPPQYDPRQVQQMAGPGQPGAYGYRVDGFPGAYQETEGGAIAALILSISSWVFCPFISAVIALFLASSSKAKIRAFPQRYNGLGLITAANIIAWLNIAMIAVVVVIVIAAAIATSTHTGGPAPGPPPI